MKVPIKPPKVVFGNGLKISEVVDSALVVADVNTEKFASSKGPILVLPDNLEATYENVQLITKQSQRSNILVALGGGTINDLCKYSAYLQGKKYIAWPTCASVNGYSSTTASITVSGYKESRQARPPTAIYCDLDILAGAPLRLSLSGVADLLCRYTVQRDWLISHVLLGTSYYPKLLNEVIAVEGKLVATPHLLRNGDQEAIKLLMQGLLLSGNAMTNLGSSLCASQGEHMIAHTLEMKALNCSFGNTNRGLLHGEKVALGTYYSLANFRIPKVLDPYQLDHKLIHDYFGEAIASKCLAAINNKLLLNIDLLNIKLAESDIIGKINEIPCFDLLKFFGELGMPMLPEDLNIEYNEFLLACKLAFATRDRFTFLDLLELSSSN